MTQGDAELESAQPGRADGADSDDAESERETPPHAHSHDVGKEQADGSSARRPLRPHTAPTGALAMEPHCRLPAINPAGDKPRIALAIACGMVCWTLHVASAARRVVCSALAHRIAPRLGVLLGRPMVRRSVAQCIAPIAWPGYCGCTQPPPPGPLVCTRSTRALGLLFRYRSLQGATLGMPAPSMRSAERAASAQQIVPERALHRIASHRIASHRLPPSRWVVHTAARCTVRCIAVSGVLHDVLYVACRCVCATARCMPSVVAPHSAQPAAGQPCRALRTVRRASSSRFCAERWLSFPPLGSIVS